jgi:hypothetical protein
VPFPEPNRVSHVLLYIVLFSLAFVLALAAVFYLRRRRGPEPNPGG